MDYKVALVVMMAAMALTSAAPGTVIYHRDFFDPLYTGANTFSAGTSAGSSAGSAATAAAPAGNAAGSATAGTGGGQGAGRAGGTAGSAGGFNNFFNNPALFHLYNEDFELDPEDLGLFRGGGGLFDFDVEDGFFPYF